jgi:hypothetical protein
VHDSKSSLISPSRLGGEGGEWMARCPRSPACLPACLLSVILTFLGFWLPASSHLHGLERSFSLCLTWDHGGLRALRRCSKSSMYPASLTVTCCPGDRPAVLTAATPEACIFLFTRGSPRMGVGAPRGRSHLNWGSVDESPSFCPSWDHFEVYSAQFLRGYFTGWSPGCPQWRPSH